MMEGFSFPCASTAKPDATFKQFLKADRQRVVNPFPLLARRRNLRHDRTNPLVRLRYCASTDIADEVVSSVVRSMKYAHEQTHMGCDNSPALYNAQLLEGEALERVHQLDVAETWGRKTVKSWRELRRFATGLMAIAANISLTEELLATAVSFIKMELVVRTVPECAHWEGELGDLEEACIKYYERGMLRPLFPDFRNFYYGIKKVMTWDAYDKSRTLDNLIRVFLQGIRIKAETVGRVGWVVDSHQQCLHLAELVKRVESPSQLVDWLREIIPQEDLWIPGADFQEKQTNGARGTFLENLCQMRQWPQGEDNNSPLPKFIHPFISPVLLDTQWYLQPKVLCIYGDSHRIETNNYLNSESVMIVLKLEAILEQLIARDGICCPYYRYTHDMPEPCPCRPEWKESLRRFLHWGREGKFGPGGTWRDLPLACKHGV